MSQEGKPEKLWSSGLRRAIQARLFPARAAIRWIRSPVGLGFTCLGILGLLIWWFVDRPPAVEARWTEKSGSGVLTRSGKVMLSSGAPLPEDWEKRVADFFRAGQISQIDSVRLALTGIRASDALLGNEPTETDAPVALNPVGIAVRSSQAVFRWNGVAGARAYKLTLSQTNAVLWQRDVGTETELKFSSNDFALKSGHTYKWHVETEIGGSLRLSSPAQFYVLDDTALAEVLRMERQYSDSALVLAVVYSAFGLREDFEKQLAEVRRLNQDSKALENLVREPRRITPRQAPP